MSLNFKSLLKFLLPFIGKYLVLKAEELFKSAKSGTDKKAYVIKELENFAEMSGMSKEVDKEKLDKFVEETVAKIVNKL